MVIKSTHVGNKLVNENDGSKTTTPHSHHTGGLRKETAKHTLRCLLGCNIGEGIGAAIGHMLGMDMTSTLILAVGLAFAMGYAFTMIPMLRTMSIKQAAKVTVIGDTVSIAAMETAEISLALLIPGFMHAALTDTLFWTGLGIILPAGFAASYPAMYWAMRRGQKQQEIKKKHNP
jgi:class 3 adenylate cyclase